MQLLFPILSFLSAFFIAKPIISFLCSLKGYQSFREQGPQSHIQEKAGTPTMGALIFLLPIFVFASIYAFVFHSKEIFLVLLAIFVGAFLGAIDDLLKIVKANYKGLDSLAKLFVQLLLSSLIVFLSGRYLFVANDFVPEQFNFLLVIFEFIWAFCVIAGASNAINISDGLDGLATSLSVLAFLGFAFVYRHQGFYSLFDFSMIIVFALIAFFIFNKKPAQVFMGDTGSLALGMGLGVLAYIGKQELLLLVFAFVPVVETLSVILQVLSAKLSRRFLKKDIRIFKMAPLHHHFELSGFSEIKIVWIFALTQLILLVLFLFLGMH